MRRVAVLLAASLLVPAAPAPRPPFVQAVEFPYYLYPRQLWDRELVWLKNIGVQTIEFSIPRDWHQTAPGQFDFTGATSPRRDLLAFIRLLRRLDLHAWVRPSTAAEPGSQRAYLRALEQLLATQTASHGGPIAYVEGRVLSIDAAPAPAPVVTVSATSPSALADSRDAIDGQRAAILWTNVEDALYPAGWASNEPVFLRRNAVGLSGDEHPATAALRREAALLRNWSRALSNLQPLALPKPATGKPPAGIAIKELTSPAVSAVIVTNRGTQPYHDDLRVLEPTTRRPFVIPGIEVAPNDSLWLPLYASIGPGGLCPECSHFSGAEHIVYATAELLSLEFENGILAMEFAALHQGEVVLQLARKPVGPFLAAGRPTEFDWDDKTLRAKLKVPASQAPGNRQRIGIAIEEPETSGFFNELHRLIIGQPNTVSTTYSSADVASRSRLLLPEGFTANRKSKSPNEIDYDVTVPADLIHGDFVNLALEADGMLLGRSHVQLFRPASIRLMEAMQIHFGQQTELTPDPPIAPLDPRAGANIEISIRNNDPSIRTYHLEAAGDGLEFLPPKTEISIAGTEERRVSFRVFGNDTAPGVHDWRLRVTGAVTLDMPMRVVLIPRGRTVAWSADLDGDGYPEWILESQKIRAIFSAQDGGRWIELNAKDLNMSFLPEQGVFAAPGPVDVHANGDTLEFTGKGFTRTIRLADNKLTIEQTTPLPADGLSNERRGNTTFTIERASPTRSIFTIATQ